MILLSMNYRHSLSFVSRLIFFTLISHPLLAANPIIFDVRKSLSMTDDEPSYRDFYINAGTEAGLRKGTFINVVRTLPVHDPVQNKAQAHLNVHVARVQIIHVESKIAVARLHSETGNEERVTVDYEGVMVGDHLDLGSISADAPKTAKRKSARVPSSEESSERSSESRANTSPMLGGAQPASENSSAPSDSMSSPMPAEPRRDPTTSELAPPTTPPMNEKSSPAAGSPGMVRVPIPINLELAGPITANDVTQL